MQIITVNITQVVWPHVTNILDLRYFYQHNPLFYHLNLIPCHYWSWQRNIFWWIFLSDILFLRRKVASKQRQFQQWPIWQNLLSFELLKDKRMVKKLLQKFPCAFVLFYLETNSKSGKIYLLATMKYTWCAYLPPPFTSINHCYL